MELFSIRIQRTFQLVSTISVFSPFSFAGTDGMLHPETEKLNILKAANGGYTLQFSSSVCSTDVYDTFS